MMSSRAASASSVRRVGGGFVASANISSKAESDTANVQSTIVHNDNDGIVNATENEVVNITDTVIDTTKLKVVATNNATGTSGAVNLTNVTTLKGEGGDIKDTIAGTIGAGNVTGVPADVAVIISETTVDAQEVSDIIDTSVGVAGGSAAITTGLVTSSEIF